MTKLDIHNGKAYCPHCGKDVSVQDSTGAMKEKPGDARTVQRRWVLLGDCGHVIGERLTQNDPWEIAT